MIAIIGFGEAGKAFGNAIAALADVCAHDRVDKSAACAKAGVGWSASLSEALVGAEVVLSLVTADQSLAVARDAAGHLAFGALYLDMNSVAPDTKRAAAAVVERAGGRYADVAVMAPVHPALLAVPLLVTGPHAEEAHGALTRAGFTITRVVTGGVGQAAAIKMIRSVIVKGIEALTAEAMLAAAAANVEAEVLTALGEDWPKRALYNLERMRTHGLRRAAEMEEAAKTLAALGVEPVMTRGTIQRQRAMAVPAPALERAA